MTSTITRSAFALLLFAASVIPTHAVLDEPVATLATERIVDISTIRERVTDDIAKLEALVNDRERYTSIRLTAFKAQEEVLLTYIDGVFDDMSAVDQLWLGEAVDRVKDLHKELKRQRPLWRQFLGSRVVQIGGTVLTILILAGLVKRTRRFMREAQIRFRGGYVSHYGYIYGTPPLADSFQRVERLQLITARRLYLFDSWIKDHGKEVGDFELTSDHKEWERSFADVLPRIKARGYPQSGSVRWGRWPGTDVVDPDHYLRGLLPTPDETWLRNMNKKFQALKKRLPKIDDEEFLQSPLGRALSEYEHIFYFAQAIFGQGLEEVKKEKLSDAAEVLGNLDNAYKKYGSIEVREEGPRIRHKFEEVDGVYIVTEDEE